MTVRLVQKLTLGATKYLRGKFGKQQPAQAAKSQPLTPEEKQKLAEASAEEKKTLEAANKLKEKQQKEFAEAVKKDDDKSHNMRISYSVRMFLIRTRRRSIFAGFCRNSVIRMCSNWSVAISSRHVRRADFEIILRRMIAIRRQIYASLSKDGDPLKLIANETLNPLIDLSEKTHIS
jgi:hypothetical protein